MDNELITSMNINLNDLGLNELLSLFNDNVNFLKYLDDEIKKCNVEGEDNDK